MLSTEGGTGEAAAAVVFGGVGAAPLPVITSIQPARVPIAGGPVVINGSNVGGAVLVTVDGSVVPIAADTLSSITIIAPPHDAGAVDIVITTPAGVVTSTGGLVYDGVAPAEGSASTRSP